MNQNAQSRFAFRPYLMALTLPCCAAPAHAAFLEGSTFLVTLQHKTTESSLQIGPSAVFTVGAGVELMGFGANTDPDLPPLVDIDGSDTSILITAVADQPFAFLERLLFNNDGMPPFKKVTVDPSTTWAGFDPVRIGGTSEFLIFVNLGQLSAQAGQFVLLNVTPEPTAAATMAIGLAALVQRGRRRASLSRR